MQVERKSLSIPILACLTLICFLGSMIPLLGALFTLVLHDLVILLISLLIVNQFKLRPPLNILALVMTWIAMSVGIEATRINLHIGGVRGVLSPYSVVTNKLTSDKKIIAIHGDVNPILYAAAQRGFVSTQINAVGMRPMAGVSLFNRAGAVDITDAVFERGWIPRIGGPTYPRLTIKREQRNGIELLSVLAQQAEGQTASRFERAYALPDPHPGSENPIRDLLMPIFNDNLVRYFFQLNHPVSLNSELAKFLTSTLGPSIGDGQKLPLTEFINAVTTEVELPKGEKIGSVDSIVTAQNSLWHNSESEAFSNLCPFRPAGREFGSDGSGRTYVSLAETTPQRDIPLVLGRVSPDDVAFSYFCDKKDASLVAFRRYGQHLKVATYSSEGKLQSTAYLRKPMRFEHPAQIVESSVVRSNNDVVSFSVVMPKVLTYSPQQIIYKDRYQRIDFVVPQFGETAK